jgi:hypothetical protein
MKNTWLQMPLFPLAVLAVVLCSPLKGTGQTVQYVTLENTNAGGYIKYPVQSNQVVSLIGIAYNQGIAVQGNFPDGTTIWLPSLSSGPFQSFTGLTNISLYAEVNNGPTCATLQITTPTTANIVSNYVPADAIVIPTSVTGNVQIILESSADLVNWTAASPGTYGPSSATNRFFRVRAAVN